VSTLEERALADSDDSDRFVTSEREFAGTQADTLASFIKTNTEFVKAKAERDAARSEVERRTLVTNAMKVSIFNLAADLADRDTTIERVKALADEWDLASGSAYAHVVSELRAALEPTDQPKGTKP